MSARRVLAASYHPPQFDRDSGSRRMLDLIDILQESGSAITFVAANGLPELRHARVLQRRGIPVFNGCTDDVERVIEHGRFELALLFFWQVAETYLPIIRRLSPATRVVVDSVDLQFVRDARRLLGHGQPAESVAGLDAGYASEMIGELNVYAAADAVLTVSPKEAGLINDLTADSSLAVSVPDFEPVDASTIGFDERRGILFVGSFQHPPNVQAVEYLCKEIAPRLDPGLLRQHPIYVVGSGLNDTVRGYAAGLTNVKMIGWVPSIAPYLHRTRASVVPLLYGAGTKRKLVQTLMAGTPAVSTTVGAEGLDLEDGKHILVADDADRFARSVECLMNDRAAWERLARDGRRRIERSHSRAHAAARLLQTADELLQRRAKPAILAPPTEEQRQRRFLYKYYLEIMPLIRKVVCEHLPESAVVAVLSEGTNELLRLNGRQAWHFPQDERGAYRGERPSDSAEIITQLENLRSRGAHYLLVPRPSMWWLEHYDEFRQHLETNHELVAHDPEICLIYALQRRESPSVPADDGSPGSIARTQPLPAERLLSGKPAALTTEVSMHAANDAEIRAQRNGFAPHDPPMDHDVRLVAFYLPQYHPIPENDEWWGEGFTEWRNVARADPLFSGHRQPHIPADLGFYDLRVAETRQAQADLAQACGIGAFCYYHYWFNGKQLLEHPFEEVLRSGQPDFPFLLCWANEPWSRRWHGRDEDVLQQQTYSLEDDRNHINWLLPALADQRAFKIDGKSVFVVYQAKELPEAARTVDIWREEVLKAGLPGLYLMAVETGWDAGWDATKLGFDAKVLFQPQFTLLSTVPRLSHLEQDSLRIFDYQQAWPVLAKPKPVDYRRYDTVFPSWDNSARTGLNGWVLHNSTPEAYEAWLTLAIRRAQEQPEEHRIVFINAWNEWAEGCHLEPDQRFGRRYLEATRRAFQATAPAAAGRP